jgi:hypothetical protein
LPVALTPRCRISCIGVGCVPCGPDFGS